MHEVSAQNNPKPLKDRTIDELYRTFRRTHGKEASMLLSKEVYAAFHGEDTDYDSLSANDYQRAAMRTAGEYSAPIEMIRNAVYGLNGEAGEVIDLLKKHEFQGHQLDRDRLIDELGDVLWYAALLATATGTTLEEVMRRNIDKLMKRYPDGFDKDRSINRDKE